MAACSASDPHPQPDVEQAGARVLVEPELAADQLVLVRLGLGEGHARLGEARARVGHGRAEDDVIELVADVVVVADGLRVPRLGVTATPLPGLLRRRRQRAAERPHGPSGAQQPGHGSGRGAAAVRAHRHPLEGGQQRGQVTIDVEVAGHVCSGEAQLAGCPQHAPQRVWRPHRDGADRVDGPEGAAVPEHHPHRRVVSQQRPEQGPQRVAHRARVGVGADHQARLGER